MLIAEHLARPPMLGTCDLKIATGEIVGIIGPNGSGKTSLLRALSGVSEGAGHVTMDGMRLNHVARAVRLGLFSYMPAGRHINWPMQVRDVVALGLAQPDADNPAVEQALRRTDSLAFAHHQIDKLSTGERARVLLARALVCAPRYLLLDEPIANLDPYYQIRIMEMLRAEAARGAAVLLAIHDLQLARQYCDRLILMHRGQIMAEGPAATLLTPQLLAETFQIAADGQGWRAL